MRPILLLSLFFLFSIVVSGQKLDLPFDTKGVLKDYPYSHSFDPAINNSIRLNVGKMSKAYLIGYRDSLYKLALRQDSILKDPTKRQLLGYLFGPAQFDSTQAGSFYRQFLTWIRYLKNVDTSTFDGAPALTYFPVLPTVKDINKTAYYIYNADNSLHLLYDTAAGLTLKLNDPWIQRGYHSSVKFKLIRKDTVKAALINYYNNTIALAPGIRQLNSDTLQRKWVPGLLQLKGDVQKIKNRLTEDTLLHYILCADSLIREARTLLIRTYSTPLLSLLRINSPYFLSLLWANGGQLSLSPFSFTFPEKLPRLITPKDSQDLARAWLYDSLYNNMRNTDIGKVYKDSTTIKDIVRQQGRGREYFLASDSIKRAEQVKSDLSAFQRVNLNLYEFDYPYRLPEDSCSIIQEFDAAQNYKRVDRPGITLDAGGLKRFRKTNNIIPEEKMPIVVVHNVAQGSKLTLTESGAAIKDQSAFQALLTDSGGLGGIASLAGLFASASLTGLGSFTTSTIPASAKNIPASNPTSSVTPLSPGAAIPKLDNLRVNHFLPAPTVRAEKARAIAHPSSWGIVKAEGFTDSLLLDDHGRIVGCQPILKKFFDSVLTHRALNNRIHCAARLIEEFSTRLSSINDLCKYDTALLNYWIREGCRQFSLAIVNKVKEGYAVRDSLSNALVVLNFVTSMQNVLAPPDSLTADTSISETALRRSQTFYLDQAHTLTKDVFILSTSNTKDTVPKKAAAGYVSIAPRHLITLGVGPEITFDKYPVNYVTSSGGHLSVSQDIQSVRFTIGVHIYPWKLFQPDNRFFIHQRYGTSTWSRLSLFLGTAVPHPLENYYTGIAADIVPGLKLHTGAHWLWYTKYHIQNEQMVDKASAPRFGGWYIGLNIDPLGLTNTILAAFK